MKNLLTAALLCACFFWAPSLWPTREPEPAFVYLNHPFCGYVYRKTLSLGVYDPPNQPCLILMNYHGSRWVDLGTWAKGLRGHRVFARMIPELSTAVLVIDEGPARIIREEDK